MRSAAVSPDGKMYCCALPFGRALDTWRYDDNSGEWKLLSTTATPYVVWSEMKYVNGIEQCKIFVKHFNSTDWIQDGGTLNIDPESYGREPRIASNGVQPYVVWAGQLSLDKRIYVKHLV